MAKKNESFKYTSIVAEKLILVSLIIFILYVIILLAIDGLVFKITWLRSGVAVLIALAPFLFFGVFYLRNRDREDFMDRLAHCKYNAFFPFYFWVDKNPKRSERIDVDLIRQVAKPCDVILRRHKSYLDGLIFSQNSYFTHVGILFRDDQNNLSVLHSEGRDGVHPSALDHFVNCDDIAILRFTFDQHHTEIDIRKYIMEDDRQSTGNLQLKKEELEVFENYVRKNRPNYDKQILELQQRYEDTYAPLILERAKSLIDTPYDFDFNFHNFNSLSCIEYVWYCFKTLFPVHQIKVRDFEYFWMFRLPIIVPDVFIKNKHFRYIYSSLTNIHTKRQLKQSSKKGSLQLAFFLLIMLFWEILALCVLYYAYEFVSGDLSMRHVA